MTITIHQQVLEQRESYVVEDSTSGKTMECSTRKEAQKVKNHWTAESIARIGQGGRR